MKVFEADRATTSAVNRGSAPALIAMVMARGTSKTVAPTLDTTSVKIEWTHSVSKKIKT
jgi:hypothetical protein